MEGSEAHETRTPHHGVAVILQMTNVSRIASLRIAIVPNDDDKKPFGGEVEQIGQLRKRVTKIKFYVGDWLSLLCESNLRYHGAQ